MLQPEYDYDLFNHSVPSSLFPTDDASNYDRSSSAPPPQGLQNIKSVSNANSQQPVPPVYNPGQAWNLWKNESSTDNGKFNMKFLITA